LTDAMVCWVNANQAAWHWRPNTQVTYL